MKSVKAVPISHPTSPFLDAQLEETHRELVKISQDICNHDWGKKPETPRKVGIQIQSHTTKSWQTVIFELRTVDDYNIFGDLYEAQCMKIRG